MEFLCHILFEHWSVASNEVYWVERILCPVLWSEYFFKGPENVESNLELYLSVIEIQEKKN